MKFNVEFENVKTGFKWNQVLEAVSEEEAEDKADNMCQVFNAHNPESKVMFELRDFA